MGWNHYSGLMLIYKNYQGPKKQFSVPWQAYKYMLAGKMYSYIGMDDRNGRPILTLKLEPGFSDLLRREYEDIVPGYYMNKTHWSTVYLDGKVPREVLIDLVDSAHQLVFLSLSKRLQKELLVL